MEKAKKQNLRNTLRATRFMLGFVWKESAGKVFILLKGIFAVIDAFYPLILIIAPGMLIDELMGEQRMERIVFFIAITMVARVVRYTILESIFGYILQKLNDILNRCVDAFFYNHISGMDFETLEKPDIQIMKGRAQGTLHGNAVPIIDRLSRLLSSTISVVAVAYIIVATLNPWVMLLVVAVTLIKARFSKWVNNRRYLEGKELDQYHRSVGGLSGILHEADHAKQLRLFN